MLSEVGATFTNPQRLLIMRGWATGSLHFSGQLLMLFCSATPARAHLGIFVTVLRCCLSRLQVCEALLFACSPALLFAGTYAHNKSLLAGFTVRISQQNFHISVVELGQSPPPRKGFMY